MTLPPLDVRDIAFIGFLIYSLLPLGTAVILSGQDQRGRLMQWCWGSGLLSLLPLIASIGAHQIPRTLLSVGFGLGFLGMLLRINALRGHLDARRQGHRSDFPAAARGPWRWPTVSARWCCCGVR